MAHQQPTPNHDERLSRAWSLALDAIDVSDAQLFQDDSVHEYFARLRRDAPVHYCANGKQGNFWSITRYRDIVAVEADPATYSSSAEHGGIALHSTGGAAAGFIEMDPPVHGEQRRTVSPISGQSNVTRLEHTMRERVSAVLDALPRGETFDWAEHVATELTAQMLATLFDVPHVDRRLLSWWSDIATGAPADNGPVESWEMRRRELARCAEYFEKLWADKRRSEPTFDVLSMMAHAPATRDLPLHQLLGNILLLIVGGNDTTRSAISGSVVALTERPSERAKLAANPALVSKLVPEIIRWQTPISHMARTAVQDTTLAGCKIRAGDRIALWYISGNRDPEMIERPDEFLVDRERARQHLSFGYGIHRCMGSRLAEMQLRVLWEEILRRRLVVELAGQPERTSSNFIHGYVRLPVVIQQ